MRKNVKEFIEKHIDLIDEFRFDELYSWAISEIPFQIGNLSYNLMEAGINLLNYVPMVHAEMFSNSIITSIELPKNIVKINRQAFLDCFGLVEIIIPESVIGIDKTAFKGCYELKNIRYTGTMEQLNRLCSIPELQDIFADCDTYAIHCSDGVVSFAEE